MAKTWQDLAVDTLLRPRVTAREILGFPSLGPGPLLQAAIAVTALGMVMGYLTLAISDETVALVSTAIFSTPLVGAVIELGAMGMLIGLTYRVGRFFGGTGELEQTATLIIWLNGVMLVLQAVSLGLLAIWPPVAAIFAFAMVGWSFWAFCGFVTELHGFRNSLMVMGGVLLTMVCLFFVAGLIFAALGVTPQEPAT